MEEAFMGHQGQCMDHHHRCLEDIMDHHHRCMDIMDLHHHVIEDVLSIEVDAMFSKHYITKQSETK